MLPSELANRYFLVSTRSFITLREMFPKTNDCCFYGDKIATGIFQLPRDLGATTPYVHQIVQTKDSSPSL